MTRTSQLAAKVNSIYAANQATVDALPVVGPKGGSNAGNIDGWTALGIAAITRAFTASSAPTLNCWSGSLPTPSQAIPSCMVADVTKAYLKIYNR